LPDCTAPAGLTAAQDALRQAEQAHDKADKAVRSVERARDRVVDEQSAIADRITRCRQTLAASPLDGDLIAVLTATDIDTETLTTAAVNAGEQFAEAVRRRMDLDARVKATAADVVKARLVFAEAGRAPRCGAAGHRISPLRSARSA